MITERTLRQWRRDALRHRVDTCTLPKEGRDINTIHCEDLNERILRLTQELIDLRLLGGYK